MVDKGSQAGPGTGGTVDKGTRQGQAGGTVEKGAR